MRLKNFSIFIFVLMALHLISSCKKTEDLVDFTEEDEILLGQRLAEVIASDAGFNVIPTSGNSIAYAYATSRLNEITSASRVTKTEDFEWNIYLVDSEDRQAFALPGGHIYVTSGLIFFLDNEDQFSGLLTHLVAHINESHITEALFFIYGVNGLKSIAESGDADQLKSIIDNLNLTDHFLTFTRGNEIEADTLAISILSETSQSCNSVSLFFEKTLNVQADQQAQLITAHQLDLDRIETINNEVESSGCDSTVDSESASRYQAFRNSIP